MTSTHPPRSGRAAIVRRRLLSASGAGFAAAAWPGRAAHALMAGVLPDTPAARVDPNLPDSRWAGVVCVRNAGGVYSGALVHRRLVLTAAHVAGGPVSGITVQLNAGEPRLFGVARTHVHPGWKGFTKPFAFDDVALLELEGPAPDNVPVYAPYFGPMPQGTPLTFVGYGASGHGDRPPSIGAEASVKRVGANRVDRVVSRPELPEVPAIFLYDFDGPDPASNAIGGLSLGNGEETSAAGGDSGAPAFERSTETPRIAGVLGFVADFNKPGTPHSTFGASGGGALLSGVQEWLRARIAAA
ncbi:MAG: trypsin-like serine protease [Burkholderiales bacterium]